MSYMHTQYKNNTRTKPNNITNTDNIITSVNNATNKTNLRTPIGKQAAFIEFKQESIGK